MKKKYLISSIIIILLIIIVFIVINLFKKEEFSIKYTLISDCKNVFEEVNDNIYLYCITDVTIDKDNITKSLSDSINNNEITIDNLIKDLSKETLDDYGYVYRNEEYSVLSCLSPTNDYIIGSATEEYSKQVCKEKSINEDIVNGTSVNLTDTLEYTFKNNKIKFYIEDKKLYTSINDTTNYIFYDTEGVDKIGIVSFSDTNYRLVILTLNNKAYISKYNLYDNVDFTKTVELNLIKTKNTVVDFLYNNNSLYAVTKSNRYVKVVL